MPHGVPELVAWVVSRGLLPAHALPALRVEERAGRCRVLRLSGGDTHLFVKAAVGDAGSLRREITVLEALRGQGLDEHLVLPLAERASPLALCCALLDEHVTLRAHLRAAGVFEAAVMRRVGSVLGRLHAVPPAGMPNAPRPWILSELSSADARGVRHGPPAMRALYRLLLRVPHLPERLVEVGDAWAARCVTHGDPRPDNWLVRQARARDGLADAGVDGLRLVDFELGGLGDPAWDVGALLGELCALWVGAAPLVEGWPALERTAALEASLAVALAACADGYAGYGPGLARVQVARFAGARLLQIAIETAGQEVALAPHTAAYGQLGARLLREPEVLPWLWPTQETAP